MAAVAGRIYPAVRFEIESERVADFARAIGADPSDGVPPTFAAVYSLGVTAPQLFGDDEAAVDFARLLHAQQEFEWRPLPLVGQHLTSQTITATGPIPHRNPFVSLEPRTDDQHTSPICRSPALFAMP